MLPGMAFIQAEHESWRGNGGGNGNDDGQAEALEEIVYDEVTVNLSALDEELRSALEADAVGVSQSGRRVRVHVRRGTARAQVDAVMAAHRPQRLTQAQQADRDRAAALAELDKPWSEWTMADKDVLLRLLAEHLGLVADGPASWAVL